MSIYFLLIHALPFSPWYPLKSKGRFVNLFGNFSRLCAMPLLSLILCFSENGQSLHVLNLEGCRGLVLDRHQFNANLASYQVANYQLQPIQPIIRKCTELVEVTFGSTGLSYNSISFLADNLTKKVTKGQKLHFSLLTLQYYGCQKNRQSSEKDKVHLKHVRINFQNTIAPY